MIYTRIPASSVPAEALDGYALHENAVAAAAINGDGEVVGVWCAMLVLHAEPIWVRPDYRKHPSLLKRLWGAFREIASDLGARQAVSVVLESNRETVRLAEWVGAEKLKGSVWMLNMEGPCRPQ